MHTKRATMQSTTSARKLTISPMQGYQKILLPHDASEMSDKALTHALYLSKSSEAELVIMNVIDTDVIPPSSLLAFVNHDKPLDQAKEDLKSTLEGGAKQMLEERVRVCKELGAENVSHIVRAGKPVEEIIAPAEVENCDLVVVASIKLRHQCDRLEAWQGGY
jgi:nucleotide-binding universal stress UspA family protein